ncbi:MAG: hypothetical protein PHP22_08485 [Oscillospiraceae bacterium]|nr:hypothetical protein [Oscillospiraceae bacterium]
MQKEFHKVRKFTILGVLLFVSIFTFCGCKDNVPDNQNTESTSVSSSVVSESTPIPTPTPLIPSRRDFETMGRVSPMTVVFEEGANLPPKAYVLSQERVLEIPGVLDSYDVSEDRCHFAMLFDISEDGSGRLIYCDGDSITEIADEAIHYSIADEGNQIAYIKLTGESLTSGNLNVYDIDTGTTRTLSDNPGEDFALSPSGEAIAFMEKTGTGDELAWHLCVCVSGEEPKSLGENLYPIAITDDGSLVYAVQFTTEADEVTVNKSLVVYNGNEMLTLSESIYSSSSRFVRPRSEIIFNRDRKQVLFNDSDGVCFSQNGDPSVLIEPERYLYMIPWLAETQNLYCVVFNIMNHGEDNRVHLWYFTPEMKSVLLTAYEEKSGGFQVDESVLVSRENADGYDLIYLDDLFDPRYEVQYEVDDELIFNNFGPPVLLTSDKTILYRSGEGTVSNAYEGEISIFRIGDAADPAILSPNCAYSCKFVREGQPDIIYYLEYSEPDPDEDEEEQDYIAWYYYDLYMLEDSPGASPVLVAEKVSNMWCGDYGVYYYQLDSVAPKLTEFRYSSVENPGDYTEDELYDMNKLYYSSDGETFDYIANVEVRHLYGG